MALSDTSHDGMTKDSSRPCTDVHSQADSGPQQSNGVNFCGETD
jgi:hypothetical protein